MRIGWIIAVVVVAFIVWRGVEFMNAAGFFRDLEPKPQICVSVGGVIGPEDVTIDREAQRAYLSGYDRRAAAAGTPKAGAVWSYDLSDSDATPVNLTPWADETFLPHGIGLHVGADGTRRLFVVNHGGGTHTVEILEARGGRLERVSTVRGDALRSPNDVTAAGDTRFYVTNDHWYQEGHLLRTAEDFLGLPLTNVLYYDGQMFREVADGLAGANGIHLSTDGSIIYVSAARGEALRVYERDPETGNLTPRKRIAMPGLPDNIEPAPGGNLMIALHPKPLKLLSHMKNAGKHSPSQVVRVDPETGGITTLYLDPGEELSGASTAAVHDNRMLVGAIFERKFLDCTLE